MLTILLDKAVPLLIRLPIFLYLVILVLFSPGCSYVEALAVDSYLKDVNGIQFDANSMLVDMNQDLALLGGNLEQVSGATTRLQSQRQVVAEAQKAIGELEAPPPAQGLNTHLLHLYSIGLDILDDLVRLGNYRLESEPLLEDYQATSQQFVEKINAADDDNDVLIALREYESKLLEMIFGVEELEPPTVAVNRNNRLKADLNALLSSLRMVSEGIESGNGEEIEQAWKDVNRVLVADDDVLRQMEMEYAADIESFNKKIYSMQEVVDNINEEQTRLINAYNSR